MLYIRRAWTTVILELFPVCSLRGTVAVCQNNLTTVDDVKCRRRVSKEQAFHVELAELA